jgi:hypothetical protein
MHLMMRKNELFLEIDQLQDLPETKDLESTEEENISTGLSSKYKIKLINPRTSLLYFKNTQSSGWKQKEERQKSNTRNTLLFLF